MIKRLVTIGIIAAFVIIPGYIYVYFKGVEQGIAIYKKSNAMMKSLEAAYNFGLKDGLNWYY